MRPELKLFPPALGEGIQTVMDLMEKTEGQLSYDQIEITAGMAMNLGIAGGRYILNHIQGRVSWDDVTNLYQALRAVQKFIYEETDVIPLQDQHQKITAAYLFMGSELQRLEFQPPAVIRPNLLTSTKGAA